MFSHPWPIDYSKLRQAISRVHRFDETDMVKQLLAEYKIDSDQECLIAKQARELIIAVREHLHERPAILKFMQQYDLSTEEGIMLLCLAEALLRVPDVTTQDLLIRDKLTAASWVEFVGRSESALVNWATWGLALTGKVLGHHSGYGHAHSIWQRLLQRCSEPVVRQIVEQAIKIMSEQFVLGRTISQALKNASPLQQKGYLFSFDMLGEVARTQEDADRYFASYEKAISELDVDDKVSATSKNTKLFQQLGISIKLSALYPRFEATQAELAVPFLVSRVKHLAHLAKKSGIMLTVDAEESDRLEMSLDIFSQVFVQAQFKDWFGFGLAVQAYQKRSLAIVRWLTALAREHQRQIPVRLVKGAYWDTEIKMSQSGGYEGYPVFTRKTATDLCYLVCSQELLAVKNLLYPQFATHNAYTVAAILQMAKNAKIKPLDAGFEFQSLQGMGRELHDILLQQGYQSRIYAPVGNHEDLLPYLVRRLLENGANSSFVNQIVDTSIPIEILIENPKETLTCVSSIPHPKIPLPKNLYAPSRINSKGIDLSNYGELISLTNKIGVWLHQTWEAYPTQNSSSSQRDASKAKNHYSPSDHQDLIGQVWEIEPEEIAKTVVLAHQSFSAWQQLPVKIRAEYLRTTAQLIEQHYPELISLLIREAGKTIVDSMNEVREAVDYCRYYAELAEKIMQPSIQPGVTGEANTLQLQGRGVFLCISPWNFPLSIFIGQIVAALVTGNTVLAKPAEQTPLIAAFVIDLLYKAGIPKSVLHLVIGKGETIGAALTKEPLVAGVVFTGSTKTAQRIAQVLAARSAPLAALIAETGGINAMIVDSTALPEQVIADIIISAFNCAGQRCSALRVLCLQEDVAERMIKMLQGAMAELHLGSPLFLTTDVGPVIDQDAKDNLLAHQKFLQQNAKLIYKVPLPHLEHQGYFVAPQAYEIDDLSLINQEVFGPILPIYRYRQDQLDQLIEAINAWGYGLTFGLHSRVNATIDFVTKRINAGNIYVNRNMIGAVVESQPFGGMRLSGTGPKAGGPHYLSRFCTEKTITLNTAAMGGNATLMTLSED